jgi:hypothetical protein
MNARNKVAARLKEIADHIGGELRHDGIHWQCPTHRAGSHICAVVAPLSLRIDCARLTPCDRAELTAIAYPAMGGRA